MKRQARERRQKMGPMRGWTRLREGGGGMEKMMWLCSETNGAKGKKEGRKEGSDKTGLDWTGLSGNKRRMKEGPSVWYVAGNGHKGRMACPCLVPSLFLSCISRSDPPVSSFSTPLYSTPLSSSFLPSSSPPSFLLLCLFPFLSFAPTPFHKQSRPPSRRHVHQCRRVNQQRKTCCSREHNANLPCHSLAILLRPIL